MHGVEWAGETWQDKVTINFSSVPGTGASTWYWVYCLFILLFLRLHLSFRADSIKCQIGFK